MFGMAVRVLQEIAELEIGAMVRGEKNSVTNRPKHSVIALRTSTVSLQQPITINTTN
jgi:hypothetical protein